jgi:DNA-binding CsgD family transcriptional regulator
MKKLSTRERQVCNMVVSGLTSREIGVSLGISSRTVEDHRRGVLTKYGVRNAVELVRAVYGIEKTAESVLCPKF